MTTLEINPSAPVFRPFSPGRLVCPATDGGAIGSSSVVTARSYHVRDAEATG